MSFDRGHKVEKGQKKFRKKVCSINKAMNLKKMCLL